jgi:glycosyltransferase involved in cell wall biosynthesis
METDVYIKLVIEICNKLGIEELHIVQGYSPSEERNWLSGVSNAVYKLSNGITYSCIISKEQLIQFGEFDLIFSRGKYHHLHNWVSTQTNTNPLWIHYDATSMNFPHLQRYTEHIAAGKEKSDSNSNLLDSKVNGMLLEHRINVQENMFQELISNLSEKRDSKNTTPYHLILIDDFQSYILHENVFPGTIIKKFTKPCLPFRPTINYERKYDISFCGTTLQLTKNHMQFISLLRQLDLLLDTNISVGIAGDRGNIPAFSSGLSSRFENITVENLGEVPREELFDLFNNSRTLVVLSGRDCNPRIIQEAGMCGAYVIAADTLSDGFEIFSKHPLLGTIIPTKKASWFYQKNGNLIFDADKAFAQKVLNKVNIARFPYMVHKVAKSTYSVENEAQNLTTLIRLLS